MTGRAVVGVDIGGTKIAAAVVDGIRVLERVVTRTPRSGVLDAVVELVQGLGSAPVAVGVAAPGIVDPVTGVVVSATELLPGWSGTHVRDDLQDRLGVPVAVDNDVRVTAFGEARAGVGRDLPDAVYVSVGTGIGGAVWRGGRPLQGAHGSAGELAHLLVPGGDFAGICGCGRPDHLEGSVSGPALERAYARRTGRTSTLREIAARLDGSDPVATEVVDAAGRLLGRALAGLVAAIDASAVVLAGGVAQIGPPFLAPLAAALHDEALPPWRELPVVAASLGTDAPLVGAALLAGEVVAA